MAEEGNDVDKLRHAKKEDVEATIVKHTSVASASEVMAENEGQVICCNTKEKWTVELDKAKKSNKLIVIDFDAPNCDLKFEDLAKKFMSSVIFFKLSIFELQNVAQEYGVVALPAVVFIKNGSVVDKLVHAKKEDVEATIEKHTSVASA